MQYSKHKFIRKKLNDRTFVYNQNYHLQRTSNGNRDVKILVNKCDICNHVLKVSDSFEERIKILEEIDNSFESDYDKSTYESGPKLILCNYCKKEYLLPSYK